MRLKQRPAEGNRGDGLRLVHEVVQRVEGPMRPQQAAELFAGFLIEMLGVPERVVGVESDEVDHR